MNGVVAPLLTLLSRFLSFLPQPPKAAAIRSAVAHLQTLQALDAAEELTPLGFHLASLPVEPHIAKMLIFGVSHKANKPELGRTYTYSCTPRNYHLPSYAPFLSCCYLTPFDDPDLPHRLLVVAPLGHLQLPRTCPHRGRRRLPPRPIRGSVQPPRRRARGQIEPRERRLRSADDCCGVRWMGRGKGRGEQGAAKVLLG